MEDEVTVSANANGSHVATITNPGASGLYADVMFRNSKYLDSS